MTANPLPFSPSPLWLWTRSLWQRVSRMGRPAPRSLRLRETLSLGEHRFVAVIEFGQRRLLIGGTPSSLVLLTSLESEPGGEAQCTNFGIEPMIPPADQVFPENRKQKQF